jgi:hypothetical protein
MLVHPRWGGRSRSSLCQSFRYRVVVLRNRFFVLSLSKGGVVRLERGVQAARERGVLSESEKTLRLLCVEAKSRVRAAGLSGATFALRLALEFLDILEGQLCHESQESEFVRPIIEKQGDLVVELGTTVADEGHDGRTRATCK